MVRQEVSEADFKTDLEKMTVKEKYNDREDEGSELLDTSTDSVAIRAEKEEAKSTMVYLRSERSLDLGKMRATNYKYNKHVYLPKNDSTEKEALHEVRRMTMLDCFKKVTGGGKDGNNVRKKKDKDLEKEKKENGSEREKKIKSNLSKSEIAGMKSLKKRVENGDIFITETDKPRKFCVM